MPMLTLACRRRRWALGDDGGEEEITHTGIGEKLSGNSIMLSN